MTITRDEVAHLARLARLALDEAELDHLSGQLDVILNAVARVREVAAADIPPTSHAVPLTNVFRPDTLRPSLPREEVLAAAPAAEEGRFRVPRILDEAVRELLRLPATEIAAAVAKGDVSAVEVTRAHLDRIGEVDGEVAAFLHVDADGALRGREGRRRTAARRRPARPARRRPRRRQGRPYHEGRPHDLRQPHPRRLASAVRRDGRRARRAEPGSSRSAR